MANNSESIQSCYAPPGLPVVPRPHLNGYTELYHAEKKALKDSTFCNIIFVILIFSAIGPVLLYLVQTRLGGML